ncbi:hypothetical protein Mapa_002111 [Marchantia paleacea]|nr:hypothetical protein Mapa_002111 [Marchantia paleacea]
MKEIVIELWILISKETNLRISIQRDYKKDQYIPTICLYHFSPVSTFSMNVTFYHLSEVISSKQVSLVLIRTFCLRHRLHAPRTHLHTSPALLVYLYSQQNY